MGGGGEETLGGHVPENSECPRPLSATALGVQPPQTSMGNEPASPSRKHETIVAAGESFGSDG